MIKRIVYLAVPLILLAGIGLSSVRTYFSSFPEPQSIIDSFISDANAPAVLDRTDTFFDDSGSMKGYHSMQYLRLLRTLKSHIRERGEYNYYAFSAPDTILEGDVLNAVEDVSFYNQNNTYFDKVLHSISEKVKIGNNRAKHYLIITDGIQDVSTKQDYSRIVSGVSDLLDSGLYFHIIAIKTPFSGRKYPEGGIPVSYEGDSPIYCYIFSYQYDFGAELYNKLKSLGMPTELMVFGDRNISSTVTRFSVDPRNQDGSKNTFKRFKDEFPVAYLTNSPGPGGTLSTTVKLDVQRLRIDSNESSKKTPEFCGKCLAAGKVQNGRKDVSTIRPNVSVTATGIKQTDDNMLEIEYALFFKEQSSDTKTLACDLTICNWLPVKPQEWVNSWSSDCDNKSECYAGKTPFLINIINPILNRSVRKHTIGYTFIRN